MKFIFPQNYNFKTKLFGFIDYQVAILNTIIWIFLYFFLNLIFRNLYLKIILFISISFPILIISLMGFNHENVLYVIIYLSKFLKNRKIYLYIKQ